MECCLVCHSLQRGTAHLSSGFSCMPVERFPKACDAYLTWAASTPPVFSQTQQGRPVSHMRYPVSTILGHLWVMPSSHPPIIRIYSKALRWLYSQSVLAQDRRIVTTPPYLRTS